MRTGSWRILLLALLALAPALACSRPRTNGFWFEHPELVHIEAMRAGPEAPSPKSVDCTPEASAWTVVAAERQLPVDRGALTVWLSPGRLQTDAGDVELFIGGRPLPTWGEGEALQEPSFLYSPGGFLQAGVYLALPADQQPSNLDLTCRKAPPRWSRTAAALRDANLRAPLALVRNERMGRDTRPALLLPVDVRLILDSPRPQSDVDAGLAVACRQSGSLTRIDIDVDGDTQTVEIAEAERWQAVAFDGVAGRIRLVHRGDDADQCFIADPAWVEPAETTAPGMLLVIVDGLRHDVAGDPEVMPHLVERARSATAFSRARVTAPWTRPSVTSMLTGLTPREHGLETEARRLRLADEIPILPAILRRDGYATASFSANPWLGPDLGLDRGFGRLMTIQADAEHVLYEARLWIEAQRGPWFAVVFLMDTHFPFRHRPEFDRTSDNPAEPLDVGDPEVSAAYRRGSRLEPTDDALAKTRGLYLENAARVDAQLDDFFTLLGGHIDDAVIIITADHGEAFGEHGDLFHGWNLYDELLRVPLVVDLPRGEGTVIDNNVSLGQLATTLADLARVDGTALSGTPLPLAGVRPKPGIGPQFASTRFRDTDLDAVIWRRWKLITAPRSDHCQLYDLAADPEEERNVCSDNPRIRAALSELLDAHRAGRKFRAQIDAGASDAAATALESLGYLDQ